MKTLISIITINLNNVAGLVRTLESVNEYRDSFTEVIVVDGISSDGSLGIIAKFKHVIDKCIIAHDNGIYDAMNKGLDLASGSWIIFINSGDELLVHINDIRKELDDNYIFIYGVTVVRSNGKDLFSWGRRIRHAVDIIVDPPFFHQAIFYNMNFMTRFPTEYSVIADRVMTYKLVVFSEFISWNFVNYRIASFYDGGLSSRSTTKIFREELLFLKEHGLLTFGIIFKLIKRLLILRLKLLTIKTPFYRPLRMIWWNLRSLRHGE